jgi:hypothetical protein
MKNLLLLILFTSLSVCTFAQVTIMESPMSKGTFTSFSVDAEEVEQKITEREWETYLKDYKGRSKKDRKSREIRTDRLNIGGLGSNLIVFAVAIDQGSHIKMTAWFESDGVFISEDNESAVDIIENLMDRFKIHMKRVKIQMELDMENDNLKKLHKELSKMESEEKKNHDNIAKYQQRIADAESDIKNLVEQQATKAQEIEGQQLIIEKVKKRLNKVGLEEDGELKEMDKMMK